MINEKLALLGGAPIRTEPYPIHNTIGQEEIDRANAVLKSGSLSGFLARGNEQFLGGPSVKELESAFCHYFSVDFAVSMNSATSALHSALIALRIGSGDQVMVPPYTMSASAATIVQTGATPIFVDIEPDTFCIDPNLVAGALNKNVKAIVAVNLFGMASDLILLRKLCDENNIALIEDNAQAPAARCKNRFTGTIGDIGVFSLNRHKTMQVGEGGVAITNDPGLASRMRLVRNHGEAVIFDTGEFEHSDIAGYNYRLTELQASMAVPQLDKLEEFNNYRIDMAGHLSEGIWKFKFLKAPTLRPNCNHVYYLYPMLYDDKILKVDRNSFLSALQAEGIHASTYIQPVHLLPLFNKHDQNIGKCPTVERIESSSIIVTNICRPPLTRQNIREFLLAIEKIEFWAEDLREWQRRRGQQATD